jgi:RNA polymerase sigma factor (sigma-70 family)
MPMWVASRRNAEIAPTRLLQVQKISMASRTPRASHPPAAPAVDALAPLARAALAGRADAARTLIVSVTPGVLKTVRGVLGSRHPDVEDTAQDALWRFVNSLPGFRFESSVFHYACSIAVHTALNARRRERSRGEGRTDAFEHDEHETPGLSPAAALEDAARRRAMRELFDTLPTPQAEALVMHVVLGLSVEETADACGVPANTIKSRLRLAKQAVRAKALTHPLLQDELEDGDDLP